MSTRARAAHDSDVGNDKYDLGDGDGNHDLSESDGRDEDKIDFGDHADHNGDGNNNATITTKISGILHPDSYMQQGEFHVQDQLQIQRIGPRR